MVHIKKVEIFGFKSFGFKNTVIGFEPGLISIAGPNGSGKSNILDAIIFAMGENRPKIMRVDKLSSLLHDVEGHRRGPKLARVNVTLDNSDRRIPVDADTVDVTREMDGANGNTYYLNKKQTNRTQLLDLLEVANAGLNQLNTVQQGTVTRISEFSAEEKRQTIEDVVGISSFDQKKTDAIRQLDEADRRLEIALARMGEIKKRIDELEEERNQKLRYDVLEREIARLNAISAAGKLRSVRAAMETKRRELESARADGARLDGDRGAARERIRRIEERKSGFMDEADAYSRTKAEVDTELSSAMREYEEIKGSTAAAQRRISRIGARIPEIERSIREASDEDARIGARAAEEEEAVRRAESSREGIEAELHEVDGGRSAVLKRQSEIARARIEADGRMRHLTDRLNASKIALSRIESELHDTEKKAASAVSARSQYGVQSARLQRLLSRFEARIRNHSDTVGRLRLQLERHGTRRAGLEEETDDIGRILERSTRAAAQYEAKIRVVKGIMHEDYSIAQLQDDSHRLGIYGLVYQLISWDQRYERAVLAAGSDWIKAFVVQDLATLLGLAEVAKEKRLPKIKIIPLEAIPDFRPPVPEMEGVLGIMSDFVRTDPAYAGLGTFLFGNVVLTDSREAAHRVSGAGYRAVTVDGELYEARASAAVIDINSKISKLTRIITMSSSVEGLLQSIALLKKYVAKKRRAIKKTEEAMRSARDRMGVSERELASTRQSYTDLKTKAAGTAQMLATLERRLAGYARRTEKLKVEDAAERSRIESLGTDISAVRKDYADEEQAGIAADLEGLNAKKAELEAGRTGILAELHRHSSRLGAVRAEQAKVQALTGGLKDEIAALAEEREELESRTADSGRSMEECEARLVRLREREQKLIATSGTSVERLKEYDDGLKGLNERDRTLTRQISAIERKTDSLSRDLAELAESEARLKQALGPSGLDEDTETFDTGALLAGLQSEQRSLTALNAKAPETYQEVSTGYRSMSTRKNSLEEERNSIVRFIEEVERDKRQTFLDAFDRVDKEIRKIFSKMTGGDAWLELQNEDDIFSSGISYLIQFPSKKKRESTSISGGEKTLAAIVFVLALQKLNPSPFYLFDEVDAHLDAPNAERLSSILEERATESQFIMVSLKDSVVKKAGLIYGVFPKNGVSDVVEYKDRRRVPSAAAATST